MYRDVERIVLHNLMISIDRYCPPIAFGRCSANGPRSTHASVQSGAYLSSSLLGLRLVMSRSSTYE